MKRQDYNIKDAGVTYIWALLIPIIVSFIISVFISRSPKDESGHFLIFQEVWFVCVLQIISALILASIYFFHTKKNNISYNACKIAKKTNVWNVLICVVLGISLCFLTDKFITMIAIGLDKIGININSSMNVPLSSFGYYVLSLFMIALLPALTEELLYRGVVLNGLRSLGKWPAILLSSLAFCLMHGNVAQFPYTFLLGVVLGYVMFETSNLVLCFVIHFLNNATVLTQMYVTQTSELPTLNTTYVLEAVLFFVLAIGIVVLAFWLLNVIKKKQEAKNGLSKETKLESENTKTLTIGSEAKAKNSKLSQFIQNSNKEEKNDEKVEKSSQTKQSHLRELSFLFVGYVVAVILTIVALL